ncbi:hypothetical protein ACJX0J_029830 [Zea mays]
MNLDTTRQASANQPNPPALHKQHIWEQMEKLDVWDGQNVMLTFKRNDSSGMLSLYAMINHRKTLTLRTNFSVAYVLEEILKKYDWQELDHGTSVVLQIHQEKLILTRQSHYVMHRS